MDSTPTYRISTGAAWILVLCAILADVIGLIPFAKDVTASLYFIIVGVYFWTKGMGIFSGRKLAATAISWISSLIPVLQELPIEVTAGIIAIIIITRIEDRTGASLVNPLKNGSQIASARTFANFNGRREPPQRAVLNTRDRREPEFDSQSEAETV